MAQTPLVRTVLAVVIGGGFGIATSVANHASLIAGPVLSKVLDAGTSWLVVPFLIGFALKDRWWASALYGAGSLVAAVCAYYGSDAVLGSSATTALAVQELVYWMGFGVAAGAVFGLLGALTAQRVPLSFLGLIPFVALTGGYELREMSVRHTVNTAITGRGGYDPSAADHQSAMYVRMAIVAVVGCGAVLIGWLRTRRAAELSAGPSPASTRSRSR